VSPVAGDRGSPRAACCLLASAALFFPPAEVGPVHLGAALFFFYLG
jgi:hypothetical protein